MKISWRDLWLYWLLIIVVSCTYPWTDFVGHAHWSGVEWIPFQDVTTSLSRALDAFANLALYVPFGFTYIRARARSHSSTAEFMKTVFLAAGLSASCETYQVYCHNRFPSMTDLTINTIGAMLGVVVAHYYPSIRRVIIA